MYFSLSQKEELSRKERFKLSFRRRKIISVIKCK